MIEDTWIILRTSSRSTMRLAETLAKDGFDVWTPIETKIMRVARMNVRREVREPLLSTYIFARSQHLQDLLEMERMPVKPRRGKGLRDAAHADFSVMHMQGRIPLVADRHLEALRDGEKMAVPRKLRAAYAPGQSVRVVKGSFQGMAGVVERSDAKEAEVWLSLFGRHFRAKIPAFLLCAEGVQADKAVTRKAA